MVLIAALAALFPAQRAAQLGSCRSASIGLECDATDSP